MLEKQIPLANALTGYHFEIEHLDGRRLYISTKPGDIIKSGEVKEISEEGMPVEGSAFLRGNLYIHFKVKFPTQLSEEAKESLRKHLPDYTSVQILPGQKSESHFLQPIDVDRYNSNNNDSSNRNAYDSDEEMDDQSGGPQVACAQQ